MCQGQGLGRGNRGPAPKGRPVDYEPPRRPPAKVPPPPKGGLRRKLLRRAPKSVASRYYQLLPDHAAIGLYLKDKIHKAVDDKC